MADCKQLLACAAPPAGVASTITEDTSSVLTADAATDTRTRICICICICICKSEGRLASHSNNTPRPGLGSRTADARESVTMPAGRVAAATAPAEAAASSPALGTLVVGNGRSCAQRRSLTRCAAPGRPAPAR